MENSYFVPGADSQCEFIEKKSRFITYTKHITSETEAIEFIDSIRKKHADATHNCIAYRIYNPRIERFSDDGEPSGTAGMPMLEVLKKEDVYDICVVVTRYFGGILLGAGGLVRAYAKGCADGVIASGKAVREMGVTVSFEFSYSGYDRVLKLFENFSYNTVGCEFLQNVVFTVNVKLCDYNNIKEKIINLLGGNVKITELSKEFSSFK